MPPAKSANPAPRKRTRKRKRRAISVSSSSSSSESSSSEEEKSSPGTVREVPETPKPAVTSESESDSDSDTSDSSPSIVGPLKDGLPEPGPIPSQKPKLHRSPSPSPPPAKIPSFLPPRGDASAEEKEKEMKDKFRKFWMSSVADGFRDDLEELRKVRVQVQTLEPNLGTGRLALLIDSLASGSEVFSSKTDGDVSEMDVMIGS